MGGCTLQDSNLTSVKLELVSWKSVIDVTGDKKVVKKIEKGGDGFERPNEGSQVKGNLVYISQNTIHLCMFSNGLKPFHKLNMVCNYMLWQ